MHALFNSKLGRAEKILLEAPVNFCDVVFSERVERDTKEPKLLLGTALTTLQALAKIVLASMVEDCEIILNKIKKMSVRKSINLSVRWSPHEFTNNRHAN